MKKSVAKKAVKKAMPQKSQEQMPMMKNGGKVMKKGCK